jgi:hypothetical protein
MGRDKTPRTSARARDGIEIDGVGYIPEPPAWLKQGYGNPELHGKAAAEVMTLRDDGASDA